jgi:hypothetical protein
MSDEWYTISVVSMPVEERFPLSLLETSLSLVMLLFRRGNFVDGMKNTGIQFID